MGNAAGAGALTLTLWLPMPPNLGNTTFGHWASKAKARRAYMGECYLRCAAQRVRVPHGSEPPIVPARARVVIDFRLSSPRYRMDRDNKYARAKFPLDFLTRCGLIADDDDDHCDLTVTQSPRDGTEPELCSVKVTITPLSEDTA